MNYSNKFMLFNVNYTNFARSEFLKKLCVFFKFLVIDRFTKVRSWRKNRNCFEKKESHIPIEWIKIFSCLKIKIKKLLVNFCHFSVSLGNYFTRCTQKKTWTFFFITLGTWMDFKLTSSSNLFRNHSKKALCYKKHLDYIFVTEIDWNYGF